MRLSRLPLSGAERTWGREVECLLLTPACVKNVREQRMRRIVFSLLLFGLRLPMLFFFLFNVIETNFLRASSTLEFSHRLDPNRELPFEIACVNKGSLSQSQGWVDCERRLETGQLRQSKGRSAQKTQQRWEGRP
jgi:hypothetical protein